MQFIHESTRLACDANRAFRFFTMPERMSKWLGAELTIDMKTGGRYEVKADLDQDFGRIDTAGSLVESYTREAALQIMWCDTLHPSEQYQFELKLMPCRSDTEFCTELHLIFKHTERALDSQEAAFYSLLFKKMFEKLRAYVNKDWIISDSDLSLSVLRGSKL